MRIAIVTPGFSSADDDWCIPLLQDLVCGLHAGHDVQVFATCYPHVAESYAVKDVPVRSFGDGKTGRIAWAMRQIAAAMALVEEHDREAFDVVHGFWADGGGVVAALAQIRRNIPAVVTVMAGELTFEAGCSYGKRVRPVGGRVARYGASRADTLLSLSSYHQQAVATQNPQLFPARMTCGVNISRFKPAGNTQMLDGEIPILFVGSLVDVKGVDLLIRACTRAADRVAGFHLHIVGYGDKNASLRSLAKDMHAPVTFHGHIDHADLPGYYRSARFCVLGSWFESYAMVVAEAAACGRVTVGTDVGCMAVFCPKNYLCSAGDVAGMANVIVAAASEERLRPLASPASVQQMIRELVDLYATKASAR